MEKAAAEKLFKQSVTKPSSYYTSFYGGGDSKAILTMEDAYGPEKPIKKYECIGHSKKKVETSLRKKKKTLKHLVEKVVWLMLK